jgi:hypothetical protein
LRNAEKNCILQILTDKGIGKPRFSTFELPCPKKCKFGLGNTI